MEIPALLTVRKLVLIVLGLFSAGTLLADDAEQAEFFESKVRPLLFKHCYECHSAESEELKGGLAVDTKSGWVTGGDSGPAIVPGKPDESPLIDAVKYLTFEMPPQGKLSDAEIKILETWVQTGAYDPRKDDGHVKAVRKGYDWSTARDFWAFRLPESSGPPSVTDSKWPNDDLDYFVLARLESEGMSPAPDADRRTWLRRVTFDLTGLPPTIEDQQAFLADTASDSVAKAKVVDRLLASPQYGVRWGRHWLDVARYADSNGSDFNASFYNAWRYRDYVVNAFNKDKPYDQFVREQLAGDLLPYANRHEQAEQLTATTFLNIGAKMLSERDKKKLQMDVVDEQIDTVGKTFLGLTIGCARCHDHKFDPIPTADYYALAGIFKSTITLEGESQQYVSAWKETSLPVSPEHAEALKKHSESVAAMKSQLNSAKKSLDKAKKNLGRLTSSYEGIVVDNTEAKIVGDWKESTFSPNYVGEGYLHDEKTDQGQKSVTWTPKLPHAGRYEVRIAYAGSSGRDDAVPVTIQHAGGVHEAKLNQAKAASIDSLFEPLGTFEFQAGTQGSVTISNTGTTDYVIADAVQFIPVKKQTVAAAESSKTTDETAKLRQEVKAAEKVVKSLEKELKSLEQNAPAPAPMVMAAREAPQIDDCNICIRGEVKNQGKKVQRGFLQALDSGPRHIHNSEQSGRLELADWIARTDNPLTARVIVNRVWHHMFGAGLVRTVDNFGHLGERPSHPELLDTLAVEFVENGWSIKQLIRRIALSRTYAMSTEFEADYAESDPDNRLLWRSNRKRLQAESIRDAMLFVSEELDLTPNEAPMKGFRYLVVNNSSQSASGSKNTSLRRSAYLPIIRNQLPAFLTTFDFADPDVVVGKRSLTNVPAQALYLLNSPFVAARAKAMAEKLTQDETLTITDRLIPLYQKVYGRTPTAIEVEQSEQFLADQTDANSAWTQLVQALFATTEFRMLD
ncbi:DUF1553 domain-containing protein [Thalassoroseus pseudoceratinae]|uniref:DUF1553 domain-containing protein n=1 Tax=Thalassoroseus pseudoceratinae TaxID=2713176 RepID=UPI0014243761|nr:DUF1553 domain-containing protein [Thalassoroseus pseudoceratinae]